MGGIAADGPTFGAAARDVLRSSNLLPMLGSTAVVLVASTTAAVVIAALFAWLSERTTARLGWLAGVLPVVSLLVPSIAGAIDWVLLASPKAGFVDVALRELGLPIVLDVFMLLVLGVAWALRRRA